MSLGHSVGETQKPRAEEMSEEGADCVVPRGVAAAEQAWPRLSS